MEHPSRSSQPSQLCTSLLTRLGGLLSLCAILYYAVCFVNSADTLDLQIYLDSAQRLRNGDSLYEVRYSFAERGSDFELQYLYPPALAALLASLSFIPRPTLILLWQLGLVAALVGSAVILARIIKRTAAGRGRYLSSLVLFPLLAFWPPTLDGILWGQVNAYILFLLVSAAYFAVIRKDVAAGISVGLAAALKGTPLILIIPLIVHRRWRSVGSCVVALIAAHLPLLAFPSGLKPIQEFLTTTREITSGHVVNDPNYDYSLRRVVSLFADAPATVLSGLSVVVVLIYLFMTVRGKRECSSSNGSCDVLCGMQMLSAIPIMILASPLVWFHHLIWLFPVLVLIQQSSTNRVIRLAALGSYLLLAPLLYVHVYIRHFTSLPELLVKPMPLLITCLSYALIAFARSRTEKGPSASVTSPAATARSRRE